MPCNTEHLKDVSPSYCCEWHYMVWGSHAEQSACFYSMFCTSTALGQKCRVRSMDVCRASQSLHILSIAWIQGRPVGARRALRRC